ncbi:MAG: hypothetical protein Q7U51_15550 [Methanoregula sp.]|nr:hypothetical protein [Methanoregula sp.]
MRKPGTSEKMILAFRQRDCTPSPVHGTTPAMMIPTDLMGVPKRG